MNEKSLSANGIEKPEMGDPNKTPEPEKEIPDEKPEIGDESSWTKDQQEKSYYYDDSHGYEVYNPDDEEE